MKILSLFDGMSCGYIAAKDAGIEIEEYSAYEIDKYAIKASTHNFPDIKQCGDVFAADFTQYNGIDFLIGGSPCTYWSIAQSTDKRETTASGMGWDLFSQYVRALHEANPRFFIYENNKSMSKDIRASIDKAFGFEAICINSALLSAQNRQRLYWVGKRNEDGTYSKVDVQQPEDKCIFLKDILDNHQEYTDSPLCFASRGRNAEAAKGKKWEQHYGINTTNKTNTLTSVQKDNLICEPVRVGDYGAAGQGQRIYSVNGKSIICDIANHGIYTIPLDFNRPMQVGALPRPSGEISNSKGARRDMAIERLSENEMNYMVGDCGKYSDRWSYLQRPGIDEKAKCLVANISKGVPYNVCAEPVGITDKGKSFCLTGNYQGAHPEHTIEKSVRSMVAEPVAAREVGRRINTEGGKAQTLKAQYNKNGLPNFVKYTSTYGATGVAECVNTVVKITSLADGKEYTVYKVKDGKITIKDKEYPIKLKDGYYIIRKLTVRECMRLQTVPEWYEFPISNTQAYKCLGNGWTCKVITHLFKACLDS